MYFLWRKTPAAVLSKDGEWIPKGEIQSKIEQVRIFEEPGEARFVQRTKYSKSGVSVLSQKVFKEKTHIKSFPVYKSEATQGKKKGDKKKEQEVEAPVPADSKKTYYAYLDWLCEAETGQRTRVTLPPANVEATTDTPGINGARAMLSKLQTCLAGIDNREYQLKEEIKRLDLLNSDRLHQIEMLELSDEECIAIVRAMHEAQIERRRRKNELIALLAEKDILSKIDKEELKQAIKAIEGLTDQAYHCRVLTENDPIITGHKNEKEGEQCA